MWGSDTSQQKFRPTHRPSVSACGCEFDHELQFYLVARDVSLFRRQLCGPIFFVGVSTHDLLDNDGGPELSSCIGAQSRTRTIALHKIERLKFTSHARTAPYQAPFATRH